MDVDIAVYQDVYLAPDPLHLHDQCLSQMLTKLEMSLNPKWKDGQINTVTHQNVPAPPYPPHQCLSSFVIPY
jgi:hypothetical protein